MFELPLAYRRDSKRVRARSSLGEGVTNIGVRDHDCIAFYALPVLTGFCANQVICPQSAHCNDVARLFAQSNPMREAKILFCNTCFAVKELPKQCVQTTSLPAARYLNILKLSSGRLHLYRLSITPLAKAIAAQPNRKSSNRADGGKSSINFKFRDDAEA